MTLNYINKCLANLNEDLAIVNGTIEALENNTGLIEYREEKLNSGRRLRNDILTTIEAYEAKKKALMLQAQKAALQDCINEAKTDDELATYTDMLNKFNTLHPEI